MAYLGQMLHTGGLPARQSQIFTGFVSSLQPLPTSFNSTLYVVVPTWDPNFYFPITDWPACNGTLLPTAGAECLLLRDDSNNLRVVWWDDNGRNVSFTGTGTAPVIYSAWTNGVYGDSTVLMNSTPFTMIYTLPPAHTCPAGYQITVKDIGTAHNATVVAVVGGDVLDCTGGLLYLGPPETAAQALSATFQTDGVTKWRYIDGAPVVVPSGSQTVFYPEAFGAKGDNATDDTAAWQACMDAAFAATNAIIKMRPVNYVLNSAPRHDRNGNAILALPSGSGGRIIIQGAPGGGTTASGSAFNVTTSNTQSYSASYGPPSALGGPTKEQIGNNFANYQLDIRDATVILPQNSTICGIDMSRVGYVRTDNVGVYSFNPTQPTHIYNFGIRYPDPGNYGTIIADGNTIVEGQYVGVVMSTSHSTMRYVTSTQNVIGVGLVGSNQFGIVDPHATLWNNMQTSHCGYHVAGWSPTVGVQSIPANCPFILSANLWDIEDAVVTDPAWKKTTWHLLDANSQVYGQAYFNHVLAFSGLVAGALTVSGGTKLTLTNLVT